MKNFILLFLTTITSFSQTIKGTVFDEKNLPLAGANVYFDGTTIATITADDGSFALYPSGKINSLLAISYLGYQTQYISNVDATPLQIKLSLASNTLNEVVIQKDKFSRKEKLRLFRDEFLGRTPNGKSCVIENEDDIYFKYDSKSRSMRAFSDVPLHITNEALGYKIAYELVNFEVQFYDNTINRIAITRSFFAGLSYFKIVENTDKIQKKREKCYQGSQLHFFRNIANNKWGKEEFILVDKGKIAVPQSHFTVSEAGETKMVTITNTAKAELGAKKFRAYFQVLYKERQQSAILFETDTFYIDSYGNNSNIEDIVFSGALSIQKVGDMLPLNYGIE